MAAAKSKHTFIGRFADLVDESPADPYPVTDHITVPFPTKPQLEKYYEVEGEAKNEALLGDQYVPLVEFFSTQPFKYWHLFIEDFSEHVFGRGATKVEGK